MIVPLALGTRLLCARNYGRLILNVHPRISSLSAGMATVNSIESAWVKDQHGKEHYVAKTNENFETFYAAQKTCDSDQEWQECLSAMRRPLPQSFRINASKPMIGKQLVDVLLLNYELDDDVNKAVLRHMSWPDDKKFVWQVQNTSRWEIKEEDVNKNLFLFIVNENEHGNISRQELVSMVPVMLLDIQPNHKVLDMCASPGSKTKQVVELMHAKLNGKREIVPSGFVVTNEIDASRCDKLINNLTRFCSPCSLLVNHDGQHFPDLYSSNGDTLQPVKYNRIVCDVPCSGDGTLRKNPTVWKDWTPGSGNARHYVQYNLIERCAELLEVHGLVAYSSCSMNPIENEAVLARLLKQSHGALELVDCSTKMPGLNYAPGFTDWKVFDSQMTQHETYEAVDGNMRTQLHPAMFADATTNKKLHLDRCMRLLPHHNDDGGFFAALLRKTKALPWEKSSGWTNQQVLKECTHVSTRVRKGLKRELMENPIPKKRKNPVRVKVESRRGHRMVGRMYQTNDFFDFLPAKDTAMLKVLDYYGFDHPTECFYSPRGARKQLYMTNSAVKDLLANAPDDVNVFHAGLRVFYKESRGQSSVSHRLSSHGGIGFASHILGNRVLVVSPSEMITLLTAEASLEFAKTFSDATCELLAQLLASSSGVGPVKFRCQLSDETFFEAVGFLGKMNVHLDATEAEKYHGLLLLGEKSL